MIADVIIPYREGGCDYRDRNMHYVRKHYDLAHPEWNVVMAELDEGAWSKGRAINSAMCRTKADVLIIADADSIVDPRGLTKAVRWVTEGKAWAIPHGDVYRFTNTETEEFIAGYDWRHEMPDLSRAKLDRPMYRGMAGGGIVVVGADVYCEMRGIDERFEGWGGEDVSFGWVLNKLYGKGARVGEPLIHLWHPHAAPNKRGSSASEDLVERYRRSIGNREKLLEIIAEKAPIDGCVL